jgi:hypothetical protein
MGLVFDPMGIEEPTVDESLLVQDTIFLSLLESLTIFSKLLI